MNYDLVASQLRNGANQLRRTVDGMSGYDLDIPKAGPDDLGHVELAAWVKEVGEQCDLAGQAIYDDSMGTAAAVDSAANLYEHTDEGNAFNLIRLGQGPLFAAPAPGPTQTNTP